MSSSDMKEETPSSSGTQAQENQKSENATAKREEPSGTVVQPLFLHRCRLGSCESRWSGFAGHAEEQNHLLAQAATHPIVQHFKVHRSSWVTSSFQINSSDMRSILSRALDKYQDIDMDLVGWKFTPPFKPIVHRWDQLKAIQAGATEPVEKSAADKLLDFLTPLVDPQIKALKDTWDSGMVEGSCVWQILPPGELVVAELLGVPCVCRVTKYERDAYTIEYVDWNGSHSGYATATRYIRYSGMRRVTSLPIYPLAFSENKEELREKMIKRGRKFESLRGYHFGSCQHPSVGMEDNRELPTSGRVVIDAYAYYRSQNQVEPILEPLDGDSEATTHSGDNSTQGAGEDSDSEASQELMGVIKPVEPKGRVEDLAPLTDDECLLATPWLIGMDLKTKKWARFPVDGIEDVEWNDSAFDNLVIPTGEKDLAWAFVEGKGLASGGSYDDFIPGKGRGIIVLMFGPPGVGKTYTAEAVAEKARVPLYAVGAGTLGTKPAEVEAALDSILELCRLWNAMLLLDEADVFLGARTNDDLDRNELVSIFLTKLEYYEGILFLTTNRFSQIDHAFQSRTDLFLPYYPLTPEARRRVWENFLDRFGSDGFDVGAADLDKLAQLELNGREIKNLVKSSQLLGLKSGGKISADVLYTLADRRVKALQLLADH